MSTVKRGGHVSFRRPGIDPKIGTLLSRLVNGLPDVTYGTDFPIVPTWGDMHYYTGETDDLYTKNKWYAYTPNESWESMNASVVEGSALRGDIPSGVTIADYLSKFGGKMEGLIEFSEAQTLPAEKLVGEIPSGVLIRDYLKTLGGNLLGTLFMTHHDIREIKRLQGYDAQIYVEMGVDGNLTLSADSLLTLSAAVITLIGALSLIGDLSVSGSMVSSNIQAGAILNQDCSIGTSPDFSGANFHNYNLVVHDGDVVTHNGEVVHN